MALIKCSECRQEVSENATSCPHCGNPLKTNTVNVQTAPDKPIELEFTSKKWKRVILVAVVIMVGGLILFGNLKGDEKFIGIVVVIIGFFVGLVGKIGAWYSNR